MNKLTKATDISEKVKKEVWERDGGKCVYCGSRVNVAPNAHIVRRSQGGKGIATNVVTLCTNFGNGCHRKYDEGTAEEQADIDRVIVAYMKSIYGKGWNKEAQVYKKYED